MQTILTALVTGRMLTTFSMGFCSGLPLLLIGSTLKAWMTDEGVDLTVIGLFASVQLPYSFKFIWAPLLDRYKLPFLGRRRGWILLTQILLSLGLLLLAYSNPKEAPFFTAFAAFLIAFFSATQDIAVDAYRRELLLESELGLGSAMAVNGYRIGMLVAGAGALALADSIAWQTVYLALAGIMLACTVITIFSPDPEQSASEPKDLRKAVVEPFLEYFKRPGALEILAFILLYKLGDSMASDMFNPFYLGVGFTKTQVAAIAKVLGLWATILGGVLGGLAIIKLGLVRSLWIFGFFQAFSTAGFALQAQAGAHLGLLAAVIAFENLSSGMGTAAYTGFMASLCNRQYTATQYALLSSLMSVPRVVLGGSSGYLAKHMGWTTYFVFCALLAIPGLLMLLRAKRWQTPAL